MAYKPATNLKRPGVFVQLTSDELQRLRTEAAVKDVPVKILCDQLLKQWIANLPPIDREAA